MWCSQVSNAGVVVCAAGDAVVGTILVGAEVVFAASAGIVVKLEFTEGTICRQSAARQVTAQRNWLEAPDIVPSALASGRKLRRTTLCQCLRPLRRRLHDSTLSS